MIPFERAARAHANSRGSAGTRELYNADLTRWLKFCAQLEIDPVAPTMEAATAFRDSLAEKVKPPTVRRTIAALSSMYDNALDQGGRPLVSWNPFKKLPRPPAVKFGKTESITDAEAEAVIAQAQKVAERQLVGVRDVAILRMLYDTGLRVSSVVSLKRSAILRRGDHLVARVFAKGGKEVEVVLPERTTEALERWLAANPHLTYVFMTERGERGKSHLTTKAVNKRLKSYGKLAGVEHVHPHRFRAAYITAALDAGVPLHEIQAAVHHEDPKTTLRYDRGVRGTGVTSAVAAFRKKKES